MEEIFISNIFNKNLLTKLSFLIINFQVIDRHVITNSSEFAQVLNLKSEIPTHQI
jgi:hypothetical protein